MQFLQPQLKFVMQQIQMMSQRILFLVERIYSLGFQENMQLQQVFKVQEIY